MVDKPMVSKAATSVALRPILSPKCPKMLNQEVWQKMQPQRLLMTEAFVWSDLILEKKVRKNQDCCVGIDIKIKNSIVVPARLAHKTVVLELVLFVIKSFMLD